MLPEDPDSAAPLEDTYELLEPLGEGGYGVIVKARQRVTEQFVAIKRIKSEQLENAPPKKREEIHARFWREVKLVGQLRSPYCVRLIGAGVEDAQPYMVLEFVEGETLHARLRRSGALSPEHTRRIACQVLEAMVEAHAAGVVHRDLKPDNIMLTGQAARPSAKVLDFGIAGILDEFRADDGDDRVTEFGQIRGTPAYMAPEQILFFGEPRIESDLYSLGLILLECLTGRGPFDGLSSSEICRHQINTPVKLDGQAARTGFGAIIRRACRKTPEERYPSAEAMLAALEALDPSRIVEELSDDLGPQTDAFSVTNPVTSSLGPEPSPQTSPLAEASPPASQPVEVPPEQAQAPAPGRPPALWIGVGVGVVAAVALWIGLTLSPDQTPEHSAEETALAAANDTGASAPPQESDVRETASASPLPQTDVRETTRAPSPPPARPPLVLEMPTHDYCPPAYRQHMVFQSLVEDAGLQYASEIIARGGNGTVCIYIKNAGTEPIAFTEGRVWSVDGVGPLTVGEVTLQSGHVVRFRHNNWSGVFEPGAVKIGNVFLEPRDALDGPLKVPLSFAFTRGEETSSGQIHVIFSPAGTP